MNSTGGETSPDTQLQARLDTARAALADSVQRVRDRGGPDAPSLIPTAREIQRLTESLIAELARCASNNPGGAPVETLLGAEGTVPRHQVRTEIERARVAENFPAVAEGLSSGETPTANVDLLARVTNSLSDSENQAFQQHDEQLADAASRLSEESFRKRVNRLRDKIRSDGGTTAAAQVVNDSNFRVSPTTERDAYRLNGLLDPLRGAAVKAAVEREAKALADDPASSEGMTPAQLSAQALHDLVLRGDSMDRSSRPRANIRLHVLCDRDTLASGPHPSTIAETHDGLPIGAGAVGRLCCDATIRRIDTAPDGDVHVSRTARAPSESQRMALRALYPTCPISGAGWENIEIHHVVFFSESKQTVLSELIPISRRWHHVRPSATPSCSLRSQHRSHHRLSQPDGTPFRTIAPPTPINQEAKTDHDLAA